MTGGDEAVFKAESAQQVFNVSGQTVLITGGSSGLGRRFAEVLAGNGARIAVTGRDMAALSNTVESIRSKGGFAEAFSLELADTDQIKPLFDKVEAVLGPVSVLVNNAGVAGPGEALDTNFAKWRQVLAINLDAQFLIAQEAARRMSSGSSIINISSILGIGVTTGDVAYSVAKAGLTQLSQIMALEFASRGIRVNTIAPGYVVTGMNEVFFSSEESRIITDRIPLGRVGQVDDLDGVILLLASRASRFMTGAVIAVDGGHLLSL
ncbi:SDR family oxidoreductase [Chelativorans sp. Marseille-P2723]|uniref:SDR family NAD(P)-dependent oxidoreductase n=1 Tax=Chelativorans sp. Marseille-P2723 TaxID=2709133 RepID=UPI00156EF5C0|nr:SDR family oxidoreductase [Chelativorans sp. Marseille-P2723]